jgi:tetratricopeptide (TPR) repeat protein
VYFQQYRSFTAALARARGSLGTKNGSSELGSVLERHPNSAEIQWLLARQLRLEQQSEKASAALKRAQELGWPQGEIDREALLVRAQTEFSQAEPALLAALNSEPENEDLLAALASGWTRRKETKKAEAVARSMLERTPEDALAHFLLGQALAVEGEFHQAAGELERAVQLGAGGYFEDRATLAWADCLLEIGDFDKALQAYRACASDPSEAQNVLLGMGRCFWNLGRWPEAEEAFQKLLRINPDQPQALSQLAYIYEERGELQHAVDMLERAAQVAPKWYDLHFRIAKLLRALGRTDQAAEYQARAEIIKNHWAKPRDRNAQNANPYTGERASFGADSIH